MVGTTNEGGPVKLGPRSGVVTNPNVSTEVSVLDGKLLCLASLTTTQKNALTPTKPCLVYDSTLNEVWAYTTAWKKVI